MTKIGPGDSPPRSDGSGAQLAMFGLISGGAFVLFALLYNLLQPAVVANPGLAAFTPPPATRLVPLPRQSDAPPLAEVPAETASLKAFAQAAPDEDKPIAVAPTRKRPRAGSAASPPEPRFGDPYAYEPRRPDFAQQWNFGSSDWSAGNRAARGDAGVSGHVWRGGPRSAF
jgi:hypothetical protein